MIKMFPNELLIVNQEADILFSNEKYNQEFNDFAFEEIQVY